MGERKGTNKYYPPDFDPQKHGSLTGYTGQHPLRERAKKLGQGILVIRFEMPYNIWCDGCKNHIGMGVRYNAEKSKIGMYYTTPIYKFRMKCHLCDNYFEIKTDPANHDYVIIVGARRKEQRWDPKENEQIVPEDKASQKKFATDPMFKLEHGSEDKGKGHRGLSSLAELESQKSGWKEDFALNKMARQVFRDEKKAIQDARNNDQSLLTKASLDLDLVEENPDDVKMAQLLQFTSRKSYDEKREEKREAILSRSLFSRKPPTPASSPNNTPLKSESIKEQKRLKAEKMITNIVTNSKRRAMGGFDGKSLSSTRLNAADFGVVKRTSGACEEDDSVCSDNRSDDVMCGQSGDSGDGKDLGDGEVGPSRTEEVVERGDDVKEQCPRTVPLCDYSSSDDD